MFDFAQPYLLLLLLLVPIVALLYWLSRMALRRKLRRFGRPDILAHLMPDVSKYKPLLKLTLRLAALAAIVLVLARPRYGEAEQLVQSAGSEIVIAFDLSQSMKASSTDDPNGVSRLNRARMLLEKLVDRLHDDKVGLVVFAGNARMQMPLTSDTRMVQLALRNDLTPGTMAFQGTSLTEAIDMATLTFPGMRIADDDKESDGTKKSKQLAHRAIILITDAEDHEGDAVARAREAAEQDIQIDVVGVGSAKGSRIPMGNGQYLRDSDGNEVVSAFNAQIAQDIATAGNGIYVNAANPDALDQLTAKLDELAKSDLKEQRFKMSAEQFPVFAWLAIILLILDIIIVERKSAWLKGINFFTRNKNKSSKQIPAGKK